MNEKEKTRTTGELNDSVGRLLRLAEPPAPIDSATTTRVQNTVRAAWQSKVREQKTRSRRRFYLLQLAAACLVLAVSTYIYKGQGGPIGTTPLQPARIEKLAGDVLVQPLGATQARAAVLGETLEPGTTLTSGVNARVALGLANGMSVRMDRDSKLIYRGERLLGLEAGAVYVDTGPEGKDLPGLVVATDRGHIRDIGTQFEVRLDSNSARVRVREGKVIWRHEDQERSAVKGSQLLMSRDGNVVETRIPLHGDAWDWAVQAAPAYDLNGRTLTEFLDWVVREHGWQLDYSRSELKDEAQTIRLNGSTDDFTPAQALEAVLPTCGMSFSLDGGRLLIAAADEGQP